MLFLFGLIAAFPCFGTIRILTFHYNQADFIELQYKTLSTFLVEDFELIVFNDAKTKENEEAIQEVCDRYGIQCVRFPPERHRDHPLNRYLLSCIPHSTNAPWGWNIATTLDEIADHASVRHCHVIQYALDHYGYAHDDLIVLLDGDNFLVRPLSLRTLMGTYDIVGFSRTEDSRGIQRKNTRVSILQDPEHMWIVSVMFIAFDPGKLPDVATLRFHVDLIQDHPDIPDGSIGDSGSGAYPYLQKHPDLKIKEFFWHSSSIFRAYFTEEELVRMGFSDALLRMIYDIAPENVQLFAAEHFIHFSAASFERPGHRKKAQRFKEFIDEICCSGSGLPEIRF